ncbi:MAG: shikimate dehydrogenase [Coriobacteriia bacterium]
MARINGTTKLAGVIGWPLGHSLSPAMHNAVYQELGLDWAYVPLAVADEVGLMRLVAAIRSLPFVGFNVTMPYKAAILELCDEVATAAQIAGAVNTVHCTDGRLIGYNTDGRGLLETLRHDIGFDPANKRVVILGAGGAAGGAFVALILARATRITLVNRDVARAEELMERMGLHTTNIHVEALDYSEAEQAIREADLVVNATSVGMLPGDSSPIPAEWITHAHVVFDMVYGTPHRTALLKCAEAVGAQALDGLGMLVCQGAIAIEIWNSGSQTPIPRDIMRQAAQREIDVRASAEAQAR